MAHSLHLSAFREHNCQNNALKIENKTESVKVLTLWPDVWKSCVGAMAITNAQESRSARCRTDTMIHH